MVATLLRGLVALLLIQVAHSQECAADGVCDTHERCSVWKEEGECYRSGSYMKKYCPVSCRDMQAIPSRKECKDAHPQCSVWAELGECKVNTEMERFCPKSCDKCSTANTLDTMVDESCVDNHETCSYWADIGECEKNPKYMLSNCAKSCGTCSTVLKQRRTIMDDDTLLEKTAKYGVKQTATGDKAHLTLDVIEGMIHYLEKSDDFMSLPTKVQDNCKNQNELCSFWAAIGECEANVAFMKIQCAPACKSCHLIDMANRCPKLPDAVPGLKPGDLNKMFERIVETAPGNRTLTEEERLELAEKGMTEYSVVIHSRPSDKPATEISAKQDKLPPWVITFENFLTDEECDAMVQHGYTEGYKRSEDVGKQRFDGTVDSHKSKGRTSENAWCSVRHGCRDATIPKRLHDRIASITGIPPENSEDFQILRYEVGQFYNTHHDYIPHQANRQCGPRILTFFMYLSDVDAGGGTDFPDLGITVMPKKGRALLWPSVYDSKPMEADERTRHQALPVGAGTKFAANGWIHMYDYLTPQAIGCN